MKQYKPLLFLLLLAGMSIGSSSCGAIHNLFAPKSGCPSDGRNVGAERILSGEKVGKQPRFRG
ncbi:MAG TPA: hypothetical protein VNS58_12755 [Puia sp.]|nr:hypothetical protein [Puia sp.]